MQITTERDDVEKTVTINIKAEMDQSFLASNPGWKEQLLDTLRGLLTLRDTAKPAGGK
jgi:hypothetical protein